MEERASNKRNRSRESHIEREVTKKMEGERETNKKRERRAKGRAREGLLYK